MSAAQPSLYPAAETDPIEAKIAGMIDRAERALKASGCTRQPNGSWAAPNSLDGRLTEYQAARVALGRDLSYDPRLPRAERLRKFRESNPQAASRIQPRDEA